ncbi:SgcJ/EcaC family oxidoreductase [Flavobacterium sp.]|uniref:YybH family protein n=1 Tax=Flavobacterium sp. TaxID=239 RepID=UPI0025EB1477|nr:SgcJ/EcaC family oxidoreductase [Flavobacterium sp.]
MKKIQLFKIAFLALALVSLSCKKADEAPAESAKPAFDLAAAKTAVDARYREFEKAFNAKDSVALANCYTTDAEFMNPNAKALEGRPAIQKVFGEWFKGESPTLKLNLVELWGDENNLTAEDAWTMTDKDGKVVDEGKSIEVYKMEDGKWLLLRDCYNSDMPAMPMKK